MWEMNIKHPKYLKSFMPDQKEEFSWKRTTKGINMRVRKEAR